MMWLPLTRALCCIVGSPAVSVHFACFVGMMDVTSFLKASLIIVIITGHANVIMDMLEHVGLLAWIVVCVSAG